MWNAACAASVIHLSQRPPASPVHELADQARPPFLTQATDFERGVGSPGTAAIHLMFELQPSTLLAGNKRVDG
jgi:hypothetical protein